MILPMFYFVSAKTELIKLANFFMVKADIRINNVYTVSKKRLI